MIILRRAGKETESRGDVVVEELSTVPKSATPNEVVQPILGGTNGGEVRQVIAGDFETD